MSYDKSHKIGFFIAALCAVTAWMVMEAWGDDQREGRNRRSRPPRVVDQDGDGYPATVDCNDRNASIHPGALEIADDRIDQDCDGVDLVTAAGGSNGGGGTGANPHASLAWDGSPGVCLSCHGEASQANVRFGPLSVAGRSSLRRGKAAL